MATQTPNNPTFAPLVALNKIFDDRVVEMNFSSNVTLANLVNRNRVILNDGNEYFNWDVTFGGANSNWVDYDAASTISETSVTLPATIADTKKRVYHRFKVNRLTVRNLAKTAPGRLASLLQKNISDGIQVILKDLNAAIVNTVSASDIISMEAVLDDTAAYAGIGITGVSASWKPIINKNGTERAFTRALMHQHDANIRKQGTFYNYVSMNPDQELKYIAAYDAIAPTLSLPNTPSPSPFKLIDLGYGDVTYNGLPIVLEPEIPVGQIRMARLEDVELYVRDVTDGVGYTLDNNKPTVVNNSLGIPIHITELATGIPTVAEYEMWCMAQLVVRKRNSLMAITNISL